MCSAKLRCCNAQLLTRMPLISLLISTQPGPPNSCKTVSATVMLITIPSAVFLAVPGVNFWNLGYGAVPVVDGVIVGLTLFALWLAGKCNVVPRLSNPGHAVI